MADKTKFIRNYGLFWKLNDEGKVGDLTGKKNKTEQNEMVDFREQIGFYALYDDAFNLVYFGQVGKGEGHTLSKRLQQHLRGHLFGRWTQFSWFGIKDVGTVLNEKGKFPLEKKDSRAEGTTNNFIDQVEAIVIAVSEPPNNRQGGSFIGAKQYLQHHDKIKPKIPKKEMLETLDTNLKMINKNYDLILKDGQIKLKKKPK
ncbi:MAG: GIY-YIG nuclease family protein [Candidatus Halichondribacter symbioticus]